MTDRFFVYDMSGDGFQTFSTVALRDAAAKTAIAKYLTGDGWMEDVLDIKVGVITGVATKTNVEQRPDNLDENGEDEEGNYWDADWEERFDVEIQPVGFTPDWSLSDATAESLREHMAIAKAAQESERAFRKQVAAAMNELRASVARLPVSDFSTDGDAADLVRQDAVLSEINATIATLGLGGTETPL